MIQTYDYIIIGAGAAGLLLADAIGKDPFFKEKSILLLDKDAKQTNDRTWCFWEKDEGDFDDILFRTWHSIFFAGKKLRQEYSIAPYRYKMIKGEDFYASYLRKIAQHKNIAFVQDEVISIEKTTSHQLIKTQNTTYIAEKVFNSIYDYKEPLLQKKYPVLQQHFIGWFVKTDQAAFHEKTATFMDFSIAQKGNTRFMYILPFSETEALVEYTLFSEKLLEKSEYEEAIKKYLNDDLGIRNYEITETEKGSIPMTCFNFAQKNTETILYIGTAGGWTKASTGYTFMSTSKKVKKLVAHLKNEQPLNTFNKKDKFWFYDLLLLDVLFANNALGQSIFELLFKKRSPQLIFKFLDEETSFLEDFKFISSPPPWPFMKALLNRIKTGF
ncbi:lycopene cyclase family protein [Cellulophaga sp. Hel_I_12]|uniref:lycopene cyclase family protein n=1 Tax=Cellulophaga sp. Hel_I_12 TaxID=1249972 RepID=UPI0006472A80|nr:lycopene cyclase family protein [Cellulophaga sp. Hel_I_12]